MRPSQQRNDIDLSRRRFDVHVVDVAQHVADSTKRSRRSEQARATDVTDTDNAPLPYDAREMGWPSLHQQIDVQLVIAIFDEHNTRARPPVRCPVLAAGIIVRVEMSVVMRVWCRVKNHHTK